MVDHRRVELRRSDVVFDHAKALASDRLKRVVVADRVLAEQRVDDAPRGFFLDLRALTIYPDDRDRFTLSNDEGAQAPTFPAGNFP
jgi:hypothetical protein